MNNRRTRHQTTLATIDLDSIRSTLRRYILFRSMFDSQLVVYKEADINTEIVRWFSLGSIEGLKEIKVDNEMYERLQKIHEKILRNKLSKYRLTIKSELMAFLEQINTLNNKAREYQKACADMRKEVEKHNSSELQKAKTAGNIYTEIKLMADGTLEMLGFVPGPSTAVSTAVSIGYSAINELIAESYKQDFKSVSDIRNADLLAFKGTGIAISVAILNKAIEKNMTIKVYKEGTKALISGHVSLYSIIGMNMEYKKNKKAFK